MCNLNIFIKKKGVELSQILGFLSCVTLESYKTNKDAEGVYFSNTKKIVKGDDKINLCSHPKSCKKSKFILTHQRISTSGYEKDFHQPFKSDDDEFALIHNGIINEFKDVDGSDTHGFFYNHFLETFRSLKGTREKRTIKAIKMTLSGCVGSYSIAIYDSKKEIMYYFKNSSKQISFFKSDDDKILYITTRDQNKNYLYFFNREFSDMNIANDKIYKIRVGKKVDVKKVGKIPKKPTKRVKYNSYRQRDYSGYGYNRRNYTKPKLENIFEANKKLSKENNAKLGMMFNNHFTTIRGGRLDDLLLDEIMECGYSLKDFGVTRSINNGFCRNCYSEADFRDNDGNSVCKDCLIEMGRDACDGFNAANDYLNYSLDDANF